MAKVDPAVEKHYKKLLTQLVATQKAIEIQEKALKLDKDAQKAYDKAVDMSAIGKKILTEIKSMKASAPGKIAPAAKQMGKALDKELSDEHKKLQKIIKSFESDQQKALNALMKATSKELDKFIKAANDSAGDAELALAA